MIFWAWQTGFLLEFHCDFGQGSVENFRLSGLVSGLPTGTEKGIFGGVLRLIHDHFAVFHDMVAKILVIICNIDK